MYVYCVNHTLMKYTHFDSMAKVEHYKILGSVPVAGGLNIPFKKLLPAENQE